MKEEGWTQISEARSVRHTNAGNTCWAGIRLLIKGCYYAVEA